MKIFPGNDYSIELKNECSLAISELEKQTFPEEQLIINWNNQAFIGKIVKNEFEIKLSKKIIGEICVLKGKLENEKGTLKMTTGKIFKIIFASVTLFAVFGVIMSIIENELEAILGLVMTILVMRFIFLEFGFRLVSKIVIKKLTKIIGIKKLNKNVSQHRA